MPWLKSLNWRQLGLTVLLLALVAVLESKSAIGAYNTVTDHLAGLQHAALSLVCALLAFVFSAMAGAFKHDERPHIASQATLARIVSICFLLVPIGYLGSSLKHDRIETNWAAYYGSAAYVADVAITNDPMADRYDRDLARQRIAKPAPALDLADGELWLAAFFQITLISAAGVRLPAPITEAEVRHFRAVRAGKKAAATRKRNRRKPAFRLIKGGKTAKVAS